MPALIRVQNTVGRMCSFVQQGLYLSVCSQLGSHEPWRSGGDTAHRGDVGEEGVLGSTEGVRGEPAGM